MIRNTWLATVAASISQAFCVCVCVCVILSRFFNPICLLTSHTNKKLSYYAYFNEFSEQLSKWRLIEYDLSHMLIRPWLASTATINYQAIYDIIFRTLLISRSLLTSHIPNVLKFHLGIVINTLLVASLVYGELTLTYLQIHKVKGLGSIMLIWKQSKKRWLSLFLQYIRRMYHIVFIIIF